MKKAFKTLWEWRLNLVVYPILTISVILFFVLLFLLLWTNVIWPNMFARRVMTSLPLSFVGTSTNPDTSNPRLYFSYAEVIPFEQPDEMIVRYEPNEQKKLPAFHVELRTGTPNLLLRLVPDNTSADNTIRTNHLTLNFAGDKTEQAVVEVINLKNEKGLSNIPGTIQVTWYESSKTPTLAPQEESKFLEFSVETSLISVLRGLKDTRIDQNSPVILMVTAITALLTWLYQRNKEKEQKKKDQDEENKKLANEQLKAVRDLMAEQRVNDAQQKYQSIQAQGLDALLDKEDLETARRIIAIGQGNLDGQVDWQTPPPDWLNELAGALVCAAQQSPARLSRISSIRRAFPMDRCSPGPAAALAELQEVQPSQGRDWPPSPDEVPYSEEIRGRDMELINPFLDEQAEPEEAYLFKKERGLFWPHLPLLDRVESSTLPVVYVSGEPGSGKTAHALAIGKYAHQMGLMSVALAGTPQAADIYQTFSLRLLEYFRLHPTHLGYLDAHERHLLIELIRTHISDNSLQAEIDRMAHVEQWHWLDLAGPQDKKEMWKAEANTQIRLLRQEAAKGGLEGIPEKEWPLALYEVCRAVRFTKIRLAIDLSLPRDPAWAERVILPNIQAWRMSNLKAVIFVNDLGGTPTSQHGKYMDDPDVDFQQINWLDGAHCYIEDWVKHRWDMCNRGRSISEILSPDQLAELIRYSQNSPRRFIQGWRKLLNERP